MLAEARLHNCLARVHAWDLYLSTILCLLADHFELVLVEHLRERSLLLAHTENLIFEFAIVILLQVLLDRAEDASECVTV